MQWNFGTLLIIYDGIFSNNSRFPTTLAASYFRKSSIIYIWQDLSPF